MATAIYLNIEQHQHCVHQGNYNKRYPESLSRIWNTSLILRGTRPMTRGKLVVWPGVNCAGPTKKKGKKHCLPVSISVRVYLHFEVWGAIIHRNIIRLICSAAWTVVLIFPWEITSMIRRRGWHLVNEAKLQPTFDNRRGPAAKNRNDDMRVVSPSRALGCYPRRIVSTE